MGMSEGFLRLRLLMTYSILIVELRLLGRGLYRPQSLEGGLLRLRQPGRVGDVHALVGSLGLEGFETFAALNVPEFDGCVRAATGHKAAIGTEGD